MKEKELIKPDAVVVSKYFGEIPRRKYKSLVECYAMYKSIKNEIEEQELPLKITIEASTAGFYDDYLNRMIAGIDGGIYDEQRDLEMEKFLGLMGHIMIYMTSITNR